MEMTTWTGLLHQLWFSQILETSWKFLSYKEHKSLEVRPKLYIEALFYSERTPFNTNQNTGGKPADTEVPFKFRKLGRSFMVAERKLQLGW